MWLRLGEVANEEEEGRIFWGKDVSLWTYQQTSLNALYWHRPANDGFKSALSLSLSLSTYLSPLLLTLFLSNILSYSLSLSLSLGCLPIECHFCRKDFHVRQESARKCACVCVCMHMIVNIVSYCTRRRGKRCTSWEGFPQTRQNLHSREYHTTQVNIR